MMEVVVNSSDKPELEPLIMNSMRTVFDPEIPVNIVDLGLDI